MPRTLLPRTLLLTAAAALLAIAGGCSFGDARFKEVRVVSVDHVADNPLVVETANGAVKAQATDGDVVTIIAELKARTAERLAATQVIAQRDSNGALVVSVAWPDGVREGNEGCAFEITIPDVSDVVIKTSNGSIGLEELSGEATLNTTNGGIRVRRHDGPVYADTSNGRISMENVAGPVIADTSNGSVTLRGVGGPIEADSSNGRIEISLGDGGAGPVEARTSNGGISLSFGESFAGQVEIGTSNGSINVDRASGVKLLSLSRHRAVIEVGDGGPRSTLKTSNGSVRVERAGG